MRALLLFGLVVAVIAALVVVRFVGDGVPLPVPGAPDGPAAGAAGEGAAATTSVLPPGTVAAHLDRRVATATDLADAATACLRVVDHRTDRPVEGAAVRRVRDGAELAFTDEQGLAALPLRAFEQLAVVRSGHLLRLAPTRPGSTEADPQVVRLVTDTWSPRLPLAFRLPDGSRPAEVLVRFRADQERAAGPESPMPAGDVVLQRAWTEHTMLAGQPVCRDVPVELGKFAPDRVHRCPADAELRFVVPGRYTLEAASVAGFAVRLTVEVPATGSAAPVTVELQPGATVAGVVRNAAGAPLPAATVTLQGGDPLGLVATTAADGTFRLAPLAAGPLTLHVRHRDHEPQAVGPLQAPVLDVRAALQPLPATTLRGRVRLRPKLLPVADATVAWQPDGRTAAAVRTEADGTFVLRATGTTAARLAITVPGCLPYAELVEPGAPFADFDVWPGTTAMRLEAGLSGVLEGVVVDAAGTPVAGATVRWHPAATTRPEGLPGRRVLEGAVLELPLVAVSGPDGAFVLETSQLGAGRLALVDAGDAADAAVTAEVHPGDTIQGLRLRR
ncbi:MAG: carboxypeptidase regulatory-like domain-containing protein [Planctomycetes bacterium]|nr:carboxypeptidase regulatory-like domain-containing protein [Planctomycetota bacterium]